MSAVIRDDYVVLDGEALPYTGTVEDARAELAGFLAAKEAHRSTVGQPAPIPSPIVRLLLAADGEVVAAAPPTLDEIRESKRGALRTACRQAIEAGVISDALGTDHLYPTAQTDQLNVTGLALAAVADGADDPEWEAPLWCTPDGQDAWARVEHTAEQVKTVARAMKTHIQAQQDRYAARLADLTAANDQEAVEAVTW